MFVVVGIKKSENKIAVIDTDDKVIEWLSIDYLLKCQQNGIQILGFNNGQTLCQTEDVFSEIANKLATQCAKCQLMLKKDDYNRIKQLFFKLAKDYGLALTLNDIDINLDKQYIIFKLISRKCNFGNNASQLVQKGNVFVDNLDNVIQHLRTRGWIDAITVLEELKLIVDYKGNNTDTTIHYIGITPANHLYKIVIGKFVYSVHLGYSNNKSNFSKYISKTSPEDYQGYLYEKFNNISNSGLIKFIDKLSKKSITGDLDKVYKKLHDKYKTLQDIYIER